MLGIDGMGRGLEVEPSVVSVGAVQPSQRLKRWHATANGGRRGAERSLHNRRMTPGYRSRNGKWWYGSRALGRALGRVRRGATAVGIAMKVDAMVAH